MTLMTIHFSFIRLFMKRKHAGRMPALPRYAMLKFGFVFEGKLQKRMAAAKIKFLTNICAVIVDCSRMYAENIRDLFAGFIFGDHFQDSFLGRCQVLNAGSFFTQSVRTRASAE